MVKAQEVQYRGVEIVNVDLVVNRPQT